MRTIKQGETTQVEAKAIEFAHNKIAVYELPETPHSTRVAVNLFEPLGELAETVEKVDEETREYMLDRIERARRAVHLVKLFTKSPDLTLEQMQRMLAIRVGGKAGDAAYANLDVKACMVAEVTPRGVEIWCNSGPSVKGQQPVKIDLREQN